MKIQLIALISFLSFLSSCYAARIDGPYEGKVIDADTGQPIEGVVVLSEWDRSIVSPGGGISKYYDAQETVTDKNGEFKIRGLGLLVISNIPAPGTTVFKAGYEYSGLFWIPGEVPFGSRITWEGKKATIPLKKLTIEERMKNVPPLPPGEAPLRKVILMLKEMNKNSIDLKLHPIDTWGGEKL